MLMVRQESVRYAVIGGEYEGRVCTIIGKGIQNTKWVNVVFVDCDQDEFETLEEIQLKMLEKPGWEEKRSDPTYGLREHLKNQDGRGACRLRTVNVVQPRALEIGDRLATGSVVLEKPRMGYNSSALVRLDGIGWVELAPRLPIALVGKKKFRLPANLIKGKRLATGCMVVERSTVTKADWVNIFLDRKDCCIEVPSCVPLALA